LPVVPGQRLRPPWSPLLAAAPFALVVVAVVLLSTGGPGRGAQADGPVAVHLVAGRPTVAFLGDSWTTGTGATGRSGYVVRTAARLGWGYGNLGVGGSGYSVGGPHSSRFADRIPQVAALNPDVVVVQGSLNERGSTRTALRTAAAGTLPALRASLQPGTPILVIGASYDPGTPDATIDWINAAIARAAAQEGLPFVNPATANWTDPDDPSVWSDSIHPNDRGHQLIADHLEPLLRALIRQAGGPASPATVRG